MCRSPRQPNDGPTGSARPTGGPPGQPNDRPTDRPRDRPLDRPTASPHARPTDRPPDRQPDTNGPPHRPPAPPLDRPTPRPPASSTTPLPDRQTTRPTDRRTGGPTERPLDRTNARPPDSPGPAAAAICHGRGLRPRRLHLWRRRPAYVARRLETLPAGRTGVGSEARQLRRFASFRGGGTRGGVANGGPVCRPGGEHKTRKGALARPRFPHPIPAPARSASHCSSHGHMSKSSVGLPQPAAAITPFSLGSIRSRGS